MTVLFVLNAPTMPLVSELARLRSTSPKVVYWANGSVDPVGLRSWSAQADKVVVEDSIVEEVRKILDGNPVLLSEFALGKVARMGIELSRLAAHRVVIRHRADKANGPVLFFPSNDTIVRMFMPIAKHLDRWCFATPGRPEYIEEGAAALLSSLGVPYVENHPHLIDEVNPCIIVFGNDWSTEEKDVIARARSRRIPTVCIQEGCLDWGDGNIRRMEWSDFPFVQGPLTLQYLRRESYFITGNPRFDDISRLPLPERPTVMINCNFTYGIHEDVRYQWIKDVVAACKTLGIDFFISQHPRDKAALHGLPARKSNATVVHQQIAECSLLVTRFSTLVYEGLLMGRPVVYYNPHQERMKTFNEDSTGALYKVYEPNALARSTRSALNRIEEDKPLREAFLSLHCGAHDHSAAERCARALKLVAETAVTICDSARHRPGIFVPVKQHLRKVANAVFRDCYHS